MGMFGLSGFLIAYGDSDPQRAGFLYLHGGIAIFAYAIFYLSIFGLDSVKWLVINSLLGVYGIYVEMDWILSVFAKTMDDFAWKFHVIPMIYYVLYTFLIRQMLIDVLGARANTDRRKLANLTYVVLTLVVYFASMAIKNQP